MKKLTGIHTQLICAFLIALVMIAFFGCSTEELHLRADRGSENGIQSSTSSSSDARTSAVTTVRPLHTLIVFLENHSYADIVGNPAAPYINGLLADTLTAVFTQSYGVTHPSQPNYLAFFSGSTQGVLADYVPPGTPFHTANLGAELIQVGYSFAGYSEDLPYAGYTGATFNAYARKHAPWVNWQGTGRNTIPAEDNLPFTNFPYDFKQLPSVCFVIPNLNDDMHDGTIAASDAWLNANLASYIEWAKTNNSLFILTFDENDYAPLSQQILTFFTGANIKGGTYDQKINHFNVLNTVEQLYGLPHAGASKFVLPIDGVWLR